MMPPHVDYNNQCYSLIPPDHTAHATCLGAMGAGVVCVFNAFSVKGTCAKLSWFVLGALSFSAGALGLDAMGEREREIRVANSTCPRFF